MKTIALHSTDYLKAHTSTQGICLTTLSKKIGKQLEHMVTGAVIILLVTVVTIACFKVGKSAVISSHYCDAITKVVFVP